MYLNEEELPVPDTSRCLTLTWDVFKSIWSLMANLLFIGLTLTWDVFK